jgi:phosphoserine phosphatase
MTRIYLVRHGETIWNHDKIFRGRIDVGLSEKGRAEALALAGALKDRPIRFIYSSPLKRALETVAPLAEALSLPVKPMPEFVDMHFGEWEGKAVREVEEKFPEAFQCWGEDPSKAIIPGGEDLALVGKRVMEGLERVAAGHPDETGVVVSHRVTCKLALLAAFNAGAAGFWSIRQDLACINLLERDKRRWVVHFINEAGHLKKSAGHLKIDF